MNRFSVTLVLIVACYCVPTIAADTTNTERVLFPVWTDSPVAGVNGSKWVADAMINNPDDTAVGVYPVVSQYGRAAGAIGRRTTWDLTFIPDTVFGLGNGTGDDIAGRIAYINRSSADQLIYIDRLYDVTRSPAFAVDIPVVREKDLKTSRITLAHVPFDSRVRLMLRVYDPFQTPDAEVAVQFWSEWPVSNAGGGPFATPPTPQLLGSTNLKLHTTARPPSGSDLDVEPAYAQLPISADMLSNIPAYSAAAFLVDIEPVTAGLRFWAFVSVTDNSTQHVMVIAPR